MILNSPYVSGSLTVTGNIIASGSITLSGSVASASFAASATSASYALNATSASYALNSTSASFATRAITASYADALTVAGTLTAQTLVVQTITSSVDFVTGSTRFGSLLANTHAFTGSVSMTGSLTVVTTGTEFQVGATGVTLGNAVTDTHNITGSVRISGSISIGTTPVQNFTLAGGQTTPGSFSGGNYYFGIYSGSASTVLRETFAIGSDNSYVYMQSFSSKPLYINSAGNNIILGATSNVGIGTISPSDFIDAGLGLAIINTSGRTGLSLGSTQGTANEVLGRLSFTNTNSTNIGSKRLAYVSGLRGTTDNSAYLEFGTADNALGAQRMVISQEGNVFINNSSGVSLNGLTNKLSVSSTTYNLFDISRFSDNAFGPNFYLVKSRNASIGGNTIVTNGDNLGNIIWVGANGTGFNDAATIRAEVDGTPGASNDMPGRLVFSTTADGAGSVTERMRITSGGITQLRGLNGAVRLEIRNTENDAYLAFTEQEIRMWRPDGSGATLNLATQATTGTFGGHITFAPLNVERMRITGGGQTQITGPSLSAGSQGTYALNVGQSGNTNLALSANSTAGYIQSFASTPLFLNQQGNSVSANGTNGFGTVNTTSSDVRIKKNIVSIESALDKVNALRGVYYEFDKDNELEVSVPHGKTRVGLIAQEVETIIPEAVIDGDNESIPKSVDYTGLVGVLVKAIQELKAQNDDLQSQINELKAQ
jgi:hypothetical protein